MISEETQEKLVERLTQRIEELNEYILREIGRQIKTIGGLNPTKVRQVSQLIKYGESLNKIVNEISKVTELNVNEIYQIFEEEAKINQQFAKVYYEAKGIDFIPYENNIPLQRQVKAIANITANKYMNLSNTMAFATKDKNGNIIYTNIADTYQKAIDKAILSVSQGKETYNQAMENTIKELANSGIRSIDYASGLTRRLDSAVRMNVMDGMRDLSNETMRQFGDEFGADGVEITVHSNPAPDHSDVQGHQFSKEEFNKFQNDTIAVDYEGNVFVPEKDGKDRRPISELNCYHNIMYIVLGVNKPQYTKEQLNQIKVQNNKGFMFEGKHYTNYQGTQLQRKIETEIRRAKDLEVISKVSGNLKLAKKQRYKMSMLKLKYNELSNISGLPTKIQRIKAVK